MKNNTNTYTAIVAEAKRISTAYTAAADAASKDACVVQMHDLWENAKQALTRDEQTRIWAEAFAPKVSGVKRIAGKKFAEDHPNAAPPAMPAYITEAQEKRKAEKAAQPKAESKPKAAGKGKVKSAKADAPKAAKQPTQKEMLAQILVTLNDMDKRISALENKGKKSSKK